jgi:tetratricopeptide (TPR) repeat protein
MQEPDLHPLPERRSISRMTAAALALLWRAHQARRENRPADARRDLLDAVAICRREQAPADLAFALARLGQTERDLGMFDAARARYEEAAAIHRERRDALSLAHAIRQVGDIHQDAGQWELAEPYYAEALVLYRSSRQTRRGDLANAVRSMAIQKEQTGDVEHACRLWREARDLYASLDTPLRRIFLRRPNPGVVESSEHLMRLGRHQ